MTEPTMTVRVKGWPQHASGNPHVREEPRTSTFHKTPFVLLREVFGPVPAPAPEVQSTHTTPCGAESKKKHILHFTSSV